MAKQGRLRITWVKSAIGYNKDQKATITSLGFKRLGQVVEKLDSPQLRGMLFAVKHLVKWEEIDSSGSQSSSAR